MSGIETIDIRLWNPFDPGEPVYEPISGDLVTEHLAITPTVIRPEGKLHFSGRWQITHVPTGLAIPRTERDDLDEVESLALALADLAIDWATADVDVWRSDTGAAVAVVNAINAHDRDWEAQE
jgi:hypothetical protein